MHNFNDDVDGVTYCSRCGIWMGAAPDECSEKLIKQTTSTDPRVHELRRMAEALNTKRGK